MQESTSRERDGEPQREGTPSSLNLPTGAASPSPAALCPHLGLSILPVTTGKRCAEHRPRAKVGRLDNIVTRGFPTLSPELQLRW